MRHTGDRNTQSRETQFRVLLSLFPDLSLLIEDLDLVNPLTEMRYFETEPQPVSDSDRIKLRKIAESLLKSGRVYTSEQVVSLITEGLKIERQRAVNGFRMMLSSGVLTLFTGNGIRLS